MSSLLQSSDLIYRNDLVLQILQETIDAEHWATLYSVQEKCLLLKDLYLQLCEYCT